jgi:hypothetical protein
MTIPVSRLIGDVVLSSRREGPVTVISFVSGRSLFLFDAWAAVSGGHRVWADDSAKVEGKKWWWM